MPIQVVMGFDGSAPATAAIDVGAALFPGARAWMVHLWTPPFASEALRRRLWTGTRHVNEFVAVLEREGEREAERVAAIGVTLARAAGWDAEPVVHRVYGGEGLEFTQLAETLNPDVIVLGSRGLGGAQALLGSVSDMVVPEPLLSAEYAALSDGPVLVGWDGSTSAGAAVDAAGRLFPSRKRLPVLVGDLGVRGDSATSAPERLLRIEPGPGPTSRAVAEALAATARSHQAAVLVVSSRGRSAVREILLGSVAMAVLHHAYRPVMVVPPADRP